MLFSYWNNSRQTIHENSVWYILRGDIKTDFNFPMLVLSQPALLKQGNLFSVTSLVTTYYSELKGNKFSMAVGI